MIQVYTNWLTEWNKAKDAELGFVMDKLDGVIVSIIGDCESEGIDTDDLRKLLTKHRNYKTRIISKRMDVAEELDWLLKRITSKRMEGLSESESTSKPHPYKVYFQSYTSENPNLRYPEADAAKAYFNLAMDKRERSSLIAEHRTKDAAIKSFIRAFKYRLK